jgi:hypothetical protein
VAGSSASGVVVKESSTSSLVFVGPKGGREDVEVDDGEVVLVEDVVGVVTLVIEVPELAIEELVDAIELDEDEELEDDDEDVLLVVLVVDRVNA